MAQMTSFNSQSFAQDFLYVPYWWKILWAVFFARIDRNVLYRLTRCFGRHASSYIPCISTVRRVRYNKHIAYLDSVSNVKYKGRSFVGGYVLYLFQEKCSNIFGVFFEFFYKISIFLLRKCLRKERKYFCNVYPILFSLPKIIRVA